MGRETLTVSNLAGKNGGFDGSLSISYRVADNKEAPHPAFWTRNSESNDSVLTGFIGHGISALDCISSDGWWPRHQSIRRWKCRRIDRGGRGIPEAYHDIAQGGRIGGHARILRQQQQRCSREVR